MVYYRPRFVLGTMMGRQEALRSKIGGVPWGLPVWKWPRCCGGVLQKLVAQVVHEPPMVDLGDAGAVLHLFQCQECGGIGDDERGRAVFLLDRRELGEGLTMPEGYDAPSQMGRRVLGEAFIEGWEEHEDGIPAGRLEEFYDERMLRGLHEEFGGVKWFDAHNSAKFGGSPRWTGNGPMAFQGPRDFRKPSFEFLFQLDEEISIEGRCPTPDEAGCQKFYFDKDGKCHTLFAAPDKERINAPYYITYKEGAQHWSSDWINLGTDGTLYVFIDRGTKPHGVRWFWNR